MSELTVAFADACGKFGANRAEVVLATTSLLALTGESPHTEKKLTAEQEADSSAMFWPGVIAHIANLSKHGAEVRAEFAKLDNGTGQGYGSESESN